MSNPYTAPGANLNSAAVDQAEYEPRLFQMNGRIGRIRYLAYSFALTAISYLAMIVIGFIAALVSPVLGVVAVILMLIPMIVASVIIMRRRLHDLGHSGWLLLLLLIPLLGLIFALYILFAPGEKAPNRYGPKPTKNTTAMWVLGLLLPFAMIAVIGILASIAIPAYSDYTERTKANAEYLSSQQEQGQDQ